MTKNSVVLYKNFVAVVTECLQDKFNIKFCVTPATSSGKKAVYGEQKVREKDVILLHQGPCTSLETLLSCQIENLSEKILETYELLVSDETTCNEKISLQDLAELSLGSFNADQCWIFYSELKKSLEFNLVQTDFNNGNIYFVPCSQSEIEQSKQKLFEKEHETELRTAFIKRLKERKLILPDDAKFMGEVEAFALCKTEKCKTLVEAGITQDIQKAHKLLIDTGIWDYTKNPYPSRFGFSFSSASKSLGSMPDEERLVLDSVAYAIDSEHSTDPDDAIAYDGTYLWVHIADPASSVMPDSPIDIAARERGTTLYIPEGASRMLCESCLEDYALGLKNPSKALSFRIKLDENAVIEECKIFKTQINVKRLTYEQAEAQKDTDEFKKFFEIARLNLAKRTKNNAVTVQMPEVHITVDKETKKVDIVPEVRLESNLMIQEMMLLAGEGAARYAFKNQLPFPFVSQETPDFPQNLPDGYAGAFARVKCMRKRSVGITPSPHAGLGLSFYSQVTSPLRRYGDLIAHQQLRAFIDKRKIITKDEMLEKVLAGEEASIAAKKASRLSDTHWKLVYLLQNPNLEFEAFCIDKRDSDALFIIPSIDMQTTIKSIKNIQLNEPIKIKVERVDIPTQEVKFSLV